MDFVLFIADMFYEFYILGVKICNNYGVYVR
jgi:hypothetical protein